MNEEDKEREKKEKLNEWKKETTIKKDRERERRNKELEK